MISALLSGLLVTAIPSVSMRVDGEGYLRFLRKDRLVYARQATVTVVNRMLATSTGERLMPTIAVPDTVKSLAVDLEGYVVADSGKGRVSLGRLVLAILPTGKLESDGKGWVSSHVAPRLTNPGEGAAGVLRMGLLGQTEASPALPQPEVDETPVPAPSSVIHPNDPPSGRRTRKLNAGQKGSIHLEEQIQVEGDRILLGKIATIEGPDADCAKLRKLDLGVSPVIGGERGLSRTYLEAKIRSVGLKPEEFAIELEPGTKIVRASRKVSGKEQEEAAVAAAQAEMQLAIPMSSVSPVKDLFLPPGEVAIEPEKVVVNGSVGAAVSLRFVIDGEEVAKRTITVQVNRNAPRVQANAQVTLRIKYKGAIVEIPARAKTSAYVGQSVTVVTESGSTQVGTLVQANVVEVKK